MTNMKVYNLIRNINFDNLEELDIRDDLVFEKVKSIIWYPGTFNARLPYVLIDLLSECGDTVFDPFGGIGNTFFQAIGLKRFAYTNDQSQICNLFLSSVTELIRDDINVNELGLEFEEFLHSIQMCKVSIDYESELCKWFSNTDYRIVDLARKYQGTSKMKMILDMIISGSLNSRTLQNNGWGYIADNVIPYREKKDLDLIRHESNQNTIWDYIGNDNVVNSKDDERSLDYIKNLRRRYEMLVREITSLRNTIIEDQDYQKDFFLYNRTKKIDITKDKVELDNKVDLIVTSPPYPNMLDYTKSQRLSYYYYGLDFKEELFSEIGARNYRNGKDSLTTYLGRMKEAIDNSLFNLKDDGRLCVIFPHYDEGDPRQYYIDEVIKYISSNFKFILSKDRNIMQRKRELNTVISSLSKERMYFFEGRL